MFGVVPTILGYFDVQALWHVLLVVMTLPVILFLYYLGDLWAEEKCLKYPVVYTLGASVLAPIAYFIVLYFFSLAA